MTRSVKQGTFSTAALPAGLRQEAIRIALVTDVSSLLVLTMPTTEQIYNDAIALPPEARADLAERLIASLSGDVSAEITNAQLGEVRRRIAQVEAGEVALTPGDEVLKQARELLAGRLPPG